MDMCIIFTEIRVYASRNCSIHNLFSELQIMIFKSASCFIVVLTLTSSALKLAISAVYTVRPDSDNCDGQNTLEYYQNAVNFSSNMQLKFLPGLFYLKIPLIINNVTNFSLTGSADGHTAIFCNRTAAGVLFTYGDSIKIENIEINNCGYIFKTQYRWRSKIIMSSLMIVMCKNFIIQNSTFIAQEHWKLGISIHDPIGYSTVLQISSSAILIDIQNATDVINVNISNFQNIQPTMGYAISIVIHNHTKTANIFLSQIKINTDLAIFIDSITCRGSNLIFIHNLTLKCDEWPKYTNNNIIRLNFSVSCRSIPRYGSTHVWFSNCKFINIYTSTKLIHVQNHQITYRQYPFVNHIIDSLFQNITNTKIISGRSWSQSIRKPLVTLLLNNTRFEQIKALYLMDLADIFTIIQDLNRLKHHI